jgi:hypothetical protein
MFRTWYRNVAQRRMVQAARRRKVRLDVESLEDRTVPSGAALGNVFFIDMENHNLTQPSSVTSPQQLLNNPAAPYLNSLMTPGNANAAQTSYASNYYNVEFNNPAVSIHPSEPNYVWQEAGLAGPLNDADPYANTPNNIVNAPNLSALLQAAGIPWKTYQEDIDLTPTSGSVNQPGANALTSTVAPQDQWTVPLQSFSGTSAKYTNAYNGSNQYNYAVKHVGQPFFTATNGGTNTAANFSPSNPETQFYAPLQQLQTDLNNNTAARYSLITPDQYNDMHSSLDTNFTYKGVTYAHNTDQEAVALGDNFLSQIVPKIMASQAYKNNGAIVIWFDETVGGNTTSFTLPEIVISPLAKGNAYTNHIPYTHSSDLKSLEELWEVSAPGGGFLGDANTPGTHDLSNLFKPGALNPTELGGKVTLDEKGHPGVSGLTVFLTGKDEFGQNVSRTTTTASDGSYSFAGLLPGTYTIRIANDPGTTNDPETPHGTRDDIVLHGGQTKDNLDFGLQVGGKHHQKGEHGEAEGHDD